MYVPASFAETNRQLATDLIAKYPLGVLFTAGSSGLFSSTIPFQFRINDNNKQFLVAHLARANPHWKDLDNLEECLVVFSGAHNYVTPDW
ncbi:MAG: FMN-binding negative transcriptional regulator, partial [Fluviibacter sp.]